MTKIDEAIRTGCGDLCEWPQCKADGICPAEKATLRTAAILLPAELSEDEAFIIGLAAYEIADDPAKTYIKRGGQAAYQALRKHLGLTE